MSEYYDREKFAGERPPQRPPQKKNDDNDWGKWIAVIVLFSLGLWPIAFIVLFSFLADSKRKEKSRVAREREARVERALRQAEARVANARERVAQTAEGEAYQQKLDEAAAKIARAREKMNQTAEETAHRTAAQEAMDKKREATRDVQYEKTAAAKTVTVNGETVSKTGKQKKEKDPGKVLKIVGIGLLILGSIMCLDAVPSLIDGYSYALEDLFIGLGFFTGGAISMGRGDYLTRMSRRTQRYILAIGMSDTMAIGEIAKRVNRTKDQTAKELQKLIDKGYLGEDAYIDYEKGYFVRFGATVEEEEEKVVVQTHQEAEEGYAAILRGLRVANDRIPDEVMSERIERLEQISALIFKEVEAHPEKRERIRTFFDYYLPTTQKLLDTYAEFDEMGIQGENMTQAKARIEEMMDSIVEGFEHQLDQLYSADAMDVVSDIKVMEAMLSRDTASAAKDFGYQVEKTAPKDENAPIQLEF